MQLNKSEFNKVWNFWYPIVYGYFYRRLENRDIIRLLTKKSLKALFNKNDELEPVDFVWQNTKQNLCDYIKEYAENLNITSLDLSSSNTKEYEHYHFETFIKEFSNNYKQAIAEVKLSIQANLDEESVILAKQILIDGYNLEELAGTMGITKEKLDQRIVQIVKVLIKSDPQILFPQVSSVPITTVHPEGYSNPKHTLCEPWKYIFDQDKVYLDFKDKAAGELAKELGLNLGMTKSKLLIGFLGIALIGGASFGTAFVFTNSNKTTKIVSSSSSLVSSLAISSVISSQDSSEIISSEESSIEISATKISSLSPVKSSIPTSAKTSAKSVARSTAKSSIKTVSNAKSSLVISSTKSSTTSAVVSSVAKASTPAVNFTPTSAPTSTQTLVITSATSSN